MSGRRADISAVRRWLLQPWTDLGVIVPMVIAFAVPALLLSSGAAFERAVSDSVSDQVVQGLTREQQGVTLTLNGLLRSETIGPVRSLAVDRLGAVDELGPATRTLYTARGRGVVLDGDDGEERQIRASSRFFARAGAIESLDMITVDPTIRGVYVSEDLASRTGATTGSLIDVEIAGFGAVVEVEGIYRDLWPTAPDYWDDAPAALVPRFSPVFNTPTFELLIMREADMNRLGIPGVLRIYAPVERSPQTLEELEQLAGRYRSVERALVRDHELVEALQVFAALDDPVPALESATPEALSTVRTAIQRLDQPLLAAQAAGLGLGFLVVIAAATFTARKQARQLRLLVNSGQRTGWIASISIAQYLMPSLLGLGLGVLIGRFVTAMLVPSGSNLPAFNDFPLLITVNLLAVLVVGLVRGVMAVRLTERSTAEAGGVPFTAVMLLVGVAVAAWFQVGRSSQSTDVDLLVVAIPIVALCASLGVGLIGFRWLIRRAQTLSGGLPPLPLFTIRRIGHAQAGGIALAGAMGVAIGIVVFAAVVSDTQSVSLRSKTSTQIGGEVTAVLRGGVDDVVLLDDDMTAVYTLATRLTPGSGRVTVVAVDPATFATVIDWPQSFGRSADEAVSLVTPDDSTVSRSDPLPAIGLSNRSIPARGAFGSVATFGYEVVAEVQSFPFAASSGPAVLVSAEALEQAGRLRFENEIRREFGEDANLSEFESNYESPLRSFRVNVVSQQPVATFEQQLFEQGVAVRNLTSRTDLNQTVDEQATRWALGYLRFVGVVAVLAVLAATVLAADERSEQGRLRARLAPHIGVPRRLSTIAAALEGSILASVAMVGGIATSLVVAARVAPRFDPLSSIPPRIGLEVPTVRLALLGLLIIVAVSLIGFASEWRVIRSEAGDG